MRYTPESGYCLEDWVSALFKVDKQTARNAIARNYRLKKYKRHIERTAHISPMGKRVYSYSSSYVPLLLHLAIVGPEGTSWEILSSVTNVLKQEVQDYENFKFA